MGKNSKKQFRRNEKTYRGHQNLDKFLNDKKLQRKPIAKDGSCLFRAVAEQVFSSQSCHQKVRMQCVEYIQAHQDDFKEFITVSIPEYLDLLKTELWGGEVELVVLSRLYDRSIIVYNEAGGLVHEQLFQSSEDQSSGQQNSPIMLAYSGGNHYDSVYTTQHMKNTAFCQGLVYEMLFCRVTRDHMPLHCQHRLTSLYDSDIELIKKSQDLPYHERSRYLDRSTQLLSTHYSIEELESLGAYTYRNTALDVHQREKASIERRDRRVAASIQFQRGDVVIFKIGGKEMEGEIASLNVSGGCHLVYMPKSREEWAIPAKDIALKPPEMSIVTGKRTSQTRSKGQQQQQQQQYGAQTSSQQSQLPQTAVRSESSKAHEASTTSKEVPPNKKQSAQGVSGGAAKSREGKRGSVSQPLAPTPGQQQQQQNPPKVVPSGAVPATANRTPSTIQPPSASTPLAPPSTLATPSTSAVLSSTPDMKPPGTTSSTGPPRRPPPEQGAPGTTRRVAALSRAAHAQVRSHLDIKTTALPLKTTKRTDAGSLDSDNPTSSSGEEVSSTPTSPRGVDATARSGNKLPTYYNDDCWTTEQRNAATAHINATTNTGQRAPQQQQALRKEKTLSATATSDGRISGFPDTSSTKQPGLGSGGRVGKSSSAHSIKRGKGTGTGGEAKSASLSKVGLRQTASVPTIKGDSTSPSGPHPQQQQLPYQQLDTPSMTSLLLQQQSSPIQGLIDGPNSGPRNGRESPPYLDRQIPRDPSSQPQDAWPLFEDSPPAASVPMQAVTAIQPMMLNAASMARTQQQQQQQQAPPPSAPPPPTGATIGTIPSTHHVATGPLPSPPPLLVRPMGNVIPVCLLPSVESNSILTTTPPVGSTPHHPQMTSPAPPPQSPHVVPPPPAPEKLQEPSSGGDGSGGGGGQAILSSIKPQATTTQQQQQQMPPPPPQSAMSFHQAAVGSPPAATSASVFHSLMHPAQAPPHQHQHQFLPAPMPSSTLQQLFRGPPRYVYNQAQGHSMSHGPPELEGAESTPNITPLITPLQVLSNVRSPAATERAAMSPLLVNMYTQTTSPKVTDALVQTEPKKTHTNSSQTASPHTKRKFTQTKGHFVSVEELHPPPLEKDSTVALVDFAVQYSIQCLSVFLQYHTNDVTSAESLSALEALAEQRLQEQASRDESQLPTALNASQHDFLISLTTRDNMASLPFPLPGRVNPQQLKMPNEAMPTQSRAMEVGAGEVDTVLPPQSDTSLPSVGRRPIHDIPSDSASQLHPPPVTDDDKPSDLNADVTPLQEVQAPPQVPAGPTPFPVPPHMMMPGQRPPYMMPMPMYYSPGFFPGIPGMPGMPGMMMPPYPHHMIPQTHPVMQQQQQQQQQQQGSNPQEQGAAESAEEISSGPSSLAKLTPPPPPPPSLNSPQPNALPPSVELENTLVNAQGITAMDNVDSSAVQPDGEVIENRPQNPPAGVEIQTTAAELPLEHHQEPQVVTDIPLTTDIQPQLSADHYIAYQNETGLVVDPDVNISNPGLPCRGTLTNVAVDVKLLEDVEDQKTTEVKQQKHKGSRSKSSQDSKQGRSSGSSYHKQQSGNQRSGAGNPTVNMDTTTKSTTTAGTQGDTSYSKRGNLRNPRQQQQFPSGRRYHLQNSARNYPGGGGGRFGGHSSSNNGNGNGRYNQRYGNNHHGGQQTSSEHGGRPHNPNRRVYASSISGGVGMVSVGGEDDSSKTVTPIPATTNSPAVDSGDRDVPQYNQLSTSGTNANNNKSSLKSFTSYPTSPHNHPTGSGSVNGEITASTSGMVVPQSATDARRDKGSKGKQRWHFKDGTTVGEKLEFPDPNTWRWGHQMGYKAGDYTETVEDPFPNLSNGANEQEFAFKDAPDDLDEKQLQEYFPALKAQVPGRYHLEVNCPNLPAQCTNRSGGDAQARMLAGGSSRAYN